MKSKVFLFVMMAGLLGQPLACSSSDDRSGGRPAEVAAREKTDPGPPPDKRVVKTGTVSADGPEYQFDLVYTGKSDLLERIEVYVKGAGGRGQELVQGLGVNLPVPSASLEFVIEDMDFDGYQDLRLLVSETALLNSEQYKYWRFQAGGGEFVPAPELEVLCHPSFDPAAKEVGSTCGSKASDLRFAGYTYQDGKLVTVREAAVEPFSGPDFFVRVVKGPADKFPAYYEVVDPDGKSVCRTDRAPLLCDPRQVVALFTLAEENLQPGEMERYYTDPIIWRGAKKPRASLVKGHAQYLREIVTYDLDAENLTAAYDADQTHAMVEESVDGYLEDRHDSILEFAVEKRYRLVKVEQEWKIECEEVYQYHNLETEPVFNKCGLEEKKEP